MKKSIILASAFVCAAQLFAYDEVVETMSVVKSDGTTIEYNIADIERVEFNVVTNSVAYSVAPADGDAIKIAELAKVFRVSPADSGNPYQFAFGSATEVTEPADLRSGRFATQITISALKINTGLLELSADDASVVVALYEYNEDGTVKNIWEKAEAGTLSTAVNIKTKKVTLELDATYEDGTAVRASFEGTVDETDDLTALNPPKEYRDEIQYFNMDGQEAINGKISRVTKKNTTSAGTAYKQFTFETENSSVQSCYIQITDEAIGREYDITELPNNSMNFYFNSIQVSGPNDVYRNAGIEGKVAVIDNGDGTYSFSIDITNRYNSIFGGIGGTPERVIVKYDGEVVDL